MSRPRWSIAAAALSAGLGLGLTGCRVADPAESGVRIGDETLRQFEAGQTTRAWLVAVLGEPSSRSDVEGLPDTQVYRYVLQERSSGVMSLFTGGVARNNAVVYFILTDGVVTRFWADRAIERNPLGQAVEQTGGEKAMP
jgi:hypothetical protein